MNQFLYFSSYSCECYLTHSWRSQLNGTSNPRGFIIIIACDCDFNCDCDYKAKADPNEGGLRTKILK